MPNLSRRLTVWAVLCLLAALLLYGFCWLDTAMAGQSRSDADPFPYASADAVRFGIGGLRYLYQSHLLTGPHIGYPLVLAALAVNTLVLWLMSRLDAVRTRRMGRVSLAALLLTLGLGFPVLKVAEHRQNALLSQPTPGINEVITRVSAGPVWLKAARCTHWQKGCQGWSSSQWPNPTAWGLAGLALSGLAGLLPRPRKNPHPEAEALAFRPSDV